MDRLTFEGNFCDIAQCKDTPGGSFCEDGYCDQRRVWERLKAYEDTGKTPEEVAALVQAEPEFPCKVGDDVFEIVELNEIQKEETGYSKTYDIYFGKIEDISVDKNNSVWINCFYENGLRMFYEMKEFGKTVFFTYEAAEAALAAKETREAREESNGNNE